MKSILRISLRISFALIGVYVMALSIQPASASVSATPDSSAFVLYKGVVVDRTSKDPLAFASISLKGSNISTVTNSEGTFSLKVPKALSTGSIVISFLGYLNKTLPISDLHSEMNRIDMEGLPVLLPEISVVFSDAASLVEAVLKKKGTNYLSDPAIMTAFYRETIKRRRSYVSLQEAVVDIYKYPYTSPKTDFAALYKVRKNTDYQKLDTLVFKLMGGPYNTLLADVMKNSDDFFTDRMLTNYVFSFDRFTRVDDRSIYVVNFKQSPTFVDPLYYGKLYIDAQTLALVSVDFSVNIENRDAATELFIRKKPYNATVYPTKSNCHIDYVEKDGKWYMNYARVELDIRVNWKKKWFDTVYESMMEMAVTDWSSSDVENKWLKRKDRLKVSTIVADEAVGFADPEFWGDYNVIEPEKSIESAIRKIQKQLKKKE